jgi:hypothetical protein
MTRSKALIGRKAPQQKAVRERAATSASTRQVGDDENVTKAHLAIQLAVDPAVGAFRYVEWLPVLNRIVPVQMLVADTNDGRVAFDVVDERPERDLDEDGLLLVALQQHDIRLVETDRATIECEPRASNCRRIWRHRDRKLEASFLDAVDRALAEHSAPTIRTLGEMVGLRYPISTVCALICRKHLQIDLGERLGPDSVVRRHDYASPSPLVQTSNPMIGARGQ